jgi:tetratricopeptide (TPR) repeat protein
MPAPRRLAIFVLTIDTFLLPGRPIVATVGAGQDREQTATGRARQAYERAIELEEQGNAVGALSLLWEAAGLAPRDADVQNRLGEALERIGALDAAADSYRRALDVRPAFRKASNNLILALVKTGKGPEAVERARALIAESPGDTDRYFTLGLAQSEQDVEGSIQTFRKVLQMAPQHTLARYNLALVLRRADRLPDALAELEFLVRTNPRPEAHYTMGIIYWHQGDLDRATNALRAAIGVDPKYADALFALGSVLKARRDWTGSTAALQRAVEIRPDPATYYTLSQVRQLVGDDAAARAYLEESEGLRTRARLEHEALVWTSVGIQKAESGDLLAAVDNFRRATAVFEAYAPAHYQLGLVFERLGEHEASRSAFERARQLNPSLVSPRNTR